LSRTLCAGTPPIESHPFAEANATAASTVCSSSAAMDRSGDLPRVVRLHATFGHLTGVGLERPGPVKK
jgi:hypothetical protein